MASVYFSEEHEMFRQQVRRFMEKEVAPQGDEWEKARRIPRAIFRRMGELGFLGIMGPEEYGGAAGDVFLAVAFLEELARSRLGGFCAAVGVQQFMATAHIQRYGGPELKRDYLAPSMAGRKVGALAITEPDTGSDVAAIRTRAQRHEDHWLINGSKTFITNGADGDFVTLACKTDPAGGSGGVSLIVVDHDLPGVRVAQRLDKLGWHCGDTAELAFEDVRVPLDRLVGQENMGFYYLMECFQMERLCGAAIGVGSSQLCLELALDYMHQRTAFGRPLTKFQVLTHRLADLATQVEAARQLTYHAAWLMGQKQTCVRECTMAKLMGTDLSMRVADACLQCFGGFGFMEEYPLARAFRDARAGTIVAGTSEIMREIIARLMVEGGRPSPVATGPAQAPTEPEPAQTAPARDTAPEHRYTVEELFAGLPQRFRPEKTGDWEAVFHFVLTGAQASQWTVRIQQGACHVSQGLEGEPDCLVDVDSEIYLGIESGQINPQAMFMTGQIQVSDLAQMMTFIKAFRPLGK